MLSNKVWDVRSHRDVSLNSPNFDYHLFRHSRHINQFSFVFGNRILLLNLAGVMLVLL